MVFQLFSNDKSAPAEAKSSVAPLFALHGAGRAAWSPRDVSSLVRNGFAANPVGYRCARLISEAAASVPLVLQSTEERFEAHPFLSLLERPNDGQGKAALLEAVYGQLALTGGCGLCRGVMAGQWLMNMRWGPRSIALICAVMRPRCCT